MKKVFTLLFYFLCQGVNAQAFKVGDINCNYSVINYTFSIGNCSSMNPYSSQTFTFDIDSDLATDITFTSSCQGGSSNSCSYVLKISSSTGFEFVKDNSVSSPVIKNLGFGSAINSNSTWITTGYPYLNSCTFSNSFVAGQQINPFYIGFRKILSNDTIYGWIKTSSIWPGQIFSIGYKSVSDSATLPTPTFTNTITAICVSDSLVLSASPSGGYFFGPGVTGNSFYSGTLSAGNYNVMYCMVPSPVICSGKAIQTITVSPCTGINEKSINLNSMEIFPNPNNGEFEIKGVDKQNIYITNELGQQIETVELNSSNNFTSKITNLPSGVYFIGNNSVRQKIVVIK